MVYMGEIKAVFTINSWHEVGATIYHSRPNKDVCIPGRWEFHGCKPSRFIRNKYVGGCVSHYFQQGNSDPIYYVIC